VPNGGKASRRFEIHRKATVVATKTRREKDGGGGEEEIQQRRLGVRLWGCWGGDLEGAPTARSGQ
jgi:hypothetical protein